MVDRREDNTNRTAKRVFRGQELRPGSTVRSAADIMADIARRASLPADHPDYAVDDDDKTGTMGIRDSKDLRDNAAKLHKGK